MGAVNRFVSKRSIKHPSRAPWINCDLAYAIKKKKSFWKKKVRGSTDPEVFEKFRRMRQHIKNWLRASRKEYLSFIASEINSNAKPFWSFFKTKSKRCSFPDTMFLDDNTEITSDLDKAKAFSNHFQSVFTDHSLCTPMTLVHSEISIDADAPVLDEIVLSYDEVLSKLKSLNTSKSTGPDGFPARIIVECSDAICTFVCDLFNASLYRLVNSYLNGRTLTFSPFLKK